MLEFLDLICARLGDIFYNAVRTALTAARVLYGLCYLIAAICLFGLAVLLEQQMGDKVPAMDVGAFRKLQPWGHTQMDRRQFLGGVCGTAVLLPLTVHAQIWRLGWGIVRADQKCRD